MIRYYMGDPDDLDGMYRDEVISVTLEFYEDAEEAYKDMLNEAYPEVVIGEDTFMPADILEELAPTSYRVDLSNHVAEIDIDDYPEEDIDDYDE